MRKQKSFYQKHNEKLFLIAFAGVMFLVISFGIAIIKLPSDFRKGAYAKFMSVSGELQRLNDNYENFLETLPMIEERLKYLEFELYQLQKQKGKQNVN